MISLKMKRTTISAAHEPIRRTILPTSRFRSFFALLFIHPHLLSTTNNSDSRPLFPVFNALHPLVTRPIFSDIPLPNVSA